MKRPKPVSADNDLLPHRTVDLSVDDKLDELRKHAETLGLYVEWSHEAGQTPIMIVGDARARARAAAALTDALLVRFASWMYYYFDPLHDAEVDEKVKVIFHALRALAARLKALYPPY